MSFWNWFNMVTTPFIMLYPELWPRESYILWLQEICFFLDIVRKCFVAKEGSITTDSYDIFVEYLQSSMIFDLISTVPNIFGGLHPRFAFLKIVRIHELEMLSYIFKLIVELHQHGQPKSVSDDLVYAVGSLCKITIILHYLSCLWIYVGSETFIDYEQGRLPWQFANEEFLEMSLTQLYIFSTYWVCTVVTTVGYGDYTGGTTLEYEVTIFFEFFGFVIFTVLQLAVNRVAIGEYDF